MMRTFTSCRFFFVLLFGLGFFFSEKLLAEFQKDYVPVALYLTWQKDPTTTMTVQWLSTLQDEDDDIEFYEIQKEVPKEIPWKMKKGEHSQVPEDHPFLVHKTLIEDLAPDTEYCFRFGKSEKEYRFRTMPKELKAPIVFCAGGDTYNSKFKYLYNTNVQAAKQNPRFVLIGGDIAYAAPALKTQKEDFSRWLLWLKCWSDTMITSDGFLIPLICAIGNHEVKGGFDQTPDEALLFYSFFAMPGPQGYNALHFGSYLGITILDSGHTHPIAGEQSTWLDKELKTQSNLTHRFAIYHVPGYPSVRFFRSTYSSSIRRNWVPLFERHKLHVAFENHDHSYKRTFPLINGDPDPSGVVYIGDGSWGVKPRTPKKASRTLYLAKTACTRQFCRVEISQDYRKFTAITPEGEVIDEYTQILYSRDNFALMQKEIKKLKKK